MPLLPGDQDLSGLLMVSLQLGLCSLFLTSLSRTRSHLFRAREALSNWAHRSQLHPDHAATFSPPRSGSLPVASLVPVCCWAAHRWAWGPFCLTAKATAQRWLPPVAGNHIPVLGSLFSMHFTVFSSSMFPYHLLPQLARELLKSPKHLINGALSQCQ